MTIYKKKVTLYKTKTHKSSTAKLSSITIKNYFKKLIAVWPIGNNNQSIKGRIKTNKGKIKLIHDSF